MCPVPKSTAFLRCLIFPWWKLLQNKYVYISMCFLSSAAGSQMKCDVAFNLLCIKYTEQTFAFLMLGTAPSENCFQGRLRDCTSLANGLTQSTQTDSSCKVYLRQGSERCKTTDNKSQECSREDLRAEKGGLHKGERKQWETLKLQQHCISSKK